MTERDVAFAELYRAQYRSLVGFFVRRVGDLELARDLSAETFRVAWSRWDEGLADRAWLFGVARNLVGDEYRRRARQGGPLLELTERSAATGDGTSAADVRLVVAALPDRFREVLILTYWDGLSAAETAAVLGMSRSAVWMSLHRARRAFAAAWLPERAGIPAPAARDRKERLP